MSVVAGIDCGTNSIRLLVSDLSDGGKRDLHREMRVNRLGQGVDRTSLLAPEALDRTREALEAYAATCASLGVQRTRLVATSAIRDARNRDAFAELVRAALGVEPEVVSGQEEAALSFRGATSGLDPADGPFLVVDVGGGSTELVLGTSDVDAACSVDVGCVRLTERHLRTDPPPRHEVLAAERDVDAALVDARARVPVEQARTAVFVAGSATTVAAVALRLPAYDADAIHGTRLAAATAVGVCTDLIGLSRDRRAALPVMHPGRVDVIGAGALVIRRVVESLALTELVVSEADILDGIVLGLR